MAVATYGSQGAGESWILPTDERSSLADAAGDELRAFAELRWEVLARSARAFDEPDCNVVVLSAPFTARDPAGFRWHARIQPRLNVPAGFELGTGIAVTTLTPEEAAEALWGAPL